MTDVNIAYLSLTGHTLMSESPERWKQAEEMLKSGQDAETIALTLAC